MCKIVQVLLNLPLPGLNGSINMTSFPNMQFSKSRYNRVNTKKKSVAGNNKKHKIASDKVRQIVQGAGVHKVLINTWVNVEYFEYI